MLFWRFLICIILYINTLINRMVINLLIKYNYNDNNYISQQFLMYIKKRYMIPLYLNILIALILLIIEIKGAFNGGYFSLSNFKLYQVLLIPILLIPIINVVNTLFIFNVCFKKTLNGNYIVNRYKVLAIDSKKISLSDNKVIITNLLSESEIPKINSSIDVITIINNYGERILSFATKPVVTNYKQINFDMPLLLIFKPKYSITIKEAILNES